MALPQVVTYTCGSEERNGEQIRDASIGAEAVGEKAHLRMKATLNSEEIKPIAVVAIELRLSEGISQIVSQ